jgi:hypothetical protein
MSEMEATQSSDGSDNGLAEDVKDKVSAVAGQAQEKAGGAASQVKSQVRNQVDQRSTQVGEMVSSTASDLRSVGEHLRGQEKSGPAGVIERAADSTEQLGSYLTDSDGQRILRDVEDLARRQPWTVVVAGVALGFAASRFLKASSATRYRALSQPSDRSLGYSSNTGTAPVPIPSTAL